MVFELKWVKLFSFPKAMNLIFFCSCGNKIESKFFVVVADSIVILEDNF